MSKSDSTNQTCLYCGVPISPNDPRVRYCSIKCGKLAYGIRQRAQSGRPAPGTKRNCEQCGVEFTIKKHPNRFCSVTCSVTYERARRPLKPKPTRSCDHCGKVYEYIYRANRPHPYCSLDCFQATKQAKAPDTSKLGYQQTPDGQWWYVWSTNYTKAEERNCQLCGKEFIGHGKKRQFCSRSCATKDTGKERALRGEQSPHWRGGITTTGRGPSWYLARNEALERDHHTCQDCGVQQRQLERALEVHHIIPFAHFGLERHKEANEQINLVTLCRSCHVRREGNHDTLFR